MKRVKTLYEFKHVLNGQTFSEFVWLYKTEAERLTKLFGAHRVIQVSGQ